MSSIFVPYEVNNKIQQGTFGAVMKSLLVENFIDKNSPNDPLENRWASSEALIQDSLTGIKDLMEAYMDQII